MRVAPPLEATLPVAMMTRSPRVSKPAAPRRMRLSRTIAPWKLWPGDAAPVRSPSSGSVSRDATSFVRIRKGLSV